MRYLSASSLEQFRRSKLDWAMKYLEGLRGGYSVAAEKGKAFHNWIEHLVGGERLQQFDNLSDLEKWQIEADARALISRQKEFFDADWTHEFKFFKRIGGVPFKGFIDLLIVEDGKVKIYDIKKTTKTSGYKSKYGKVVEGRSYALPESELRNNIQLMVYALAIHRMLGVVEGEIGQVQAIIEKKFGKPVGIEDKVITLNFDKEYIDYADKTISEIVKDIVDFEKQYTKIGLCDTIALYEKEGLALKDLAQPKTFGSKNIYWEVYQGKKTIEELRKELDCLGEGG